MTNITSNETTKRRAGLEIWKTVVLFLVGWLGLKIVATGTQIIRCLSFGATLDEIFIFLTTNEVPQIIRNALYTDEARMAINTSVYLIIFAILLAIVNVDFKKLLSSYKSKWALLGAIIGLVTILSFNRIYSTITSFFYQMTDNDNESALDSIIVIYPIISLIIFGIVGPICEELTYRVGLFESLKKLCKSKVPAYIVTMIIFALIHFAFESVTAFVLTGDPAYMINELLNIPLYLSAAFVFTFLYDRIGFAASTNCHIFNNLLSIGLTIILSLL